MGTLNTTVKHCEDTVNQYLLLGPSLFPVQTRIGGSAAGLGERLTHKPSPKLLVTKTRLLRFREFAK